MQRLAIPQKKLSALVAEVAGFLDAHNVAQQTPWFTEADLKTPIARTFAYKDISREYAHPVIRSIKQRQRGQGARSAIDFAVTEPNRDGGFRTRYLVEAKWYRRKDPCLHAEIFRDFIRLELASLYDQAAECLFILAGEQRLISEFSREDGGLLPWQAMARCDDLSFSVEDLYWNCRRGFCPKLEPTWEYFRSAQSYKFDVWREFAPKIPLPKQIRISSPEVCAKGTFVVCGWVVSPTVVPYGDDTLAWPSSRFVIY